MALGKKTGGRERGVPNRITREFRQTVTKVLEDNAENVGAWLKSVADGSQGDPVKGFGPEAPNPGRALELIARLAEFAAPKLGRTEHVGGGGLPLQSVTIDASKMTVEQLRALASIPLAGD